MFTIIAKADTTLTPIMGQGSLNKNQMINSLLNRNKRLTVREIRDFVDFTISEANIEGVNYDILFSQMMLETNYLNFGGDVQASQNNFAGIGATGGGNPGNSFPTVQIGIRAVVQHLKAYASTEPLKQSCVDPRFQYVKRGSAEYVEYLGIQENPNGAGWASAKDYGKSILNVLSNIRTLSSTQQYSLITSFNVVGDRTTKSTLSISVGAELSGDTLYRIAAVDRSTDQWQILSEWSTNNKATYIPVNPGTHRIAVYTKHKNKTGTVEDDCKYIDLDIQLSTSSIKALNVTGELYAKSQLTITSDAIPSDKTLYKIMAVDRSTEKWITISDWSTTKSVAYTPVNPGTHRVVVYVKHKDKNGDAEDDYKYVDLYIKPAVSNVNSLEITGNKMVQSELKISANADPASNTLYKIMAVDRNTEKWVTLSDWSTTKSVTYTPVNPGTHRVAVYVKHKNKIGNIEDDYKYVDLNIDSPKSKVTGLNITGDYYAKSSLSVMATASPDDAS
ncbi:MAG: hypothetical protein GX275_00015, partial [Clostridiales bacterium]|nr:hypothetical protein [Clostridiales bacterium]